MSLTTSRSHESLASALTAERYRELAHRSIDNNTVAVPAFPATDTPDAWPGEAWEYHDWTAFDCGHVAPHIDGRAVRSSLVCPSCWLKERTR